MSGSAISVRGNPTTEEMAVVLAMLRHPAAPDGPSGYELWRQRRIAALAKSRLERGST